MKTFTITYDYLCPFARIANETLVDALESGAEYAVTFSPFSLTQNSRSATEPSVWDGPDSIDGARGVRALVWSMAIRDAFPSAFLDFHRAVFVARHDAGLDIDDEAVLSSIVSNVGVDTGAVAGIVDSGVPLAVVRREHQALVEDHGVFGVPTFVAGGEAVFVRFMERNRREDLARVIDMLDWSNLNEFKRTKVPR